MSSSGKVTTVAHSALTGVTADQHHAQAHADSDHTGPNKVDVAVAGALTGTRTRVNFVAGDAVKVTGADNGGSSRVDVTVASIPVVFQWNTGAHTITNVPAAETEVSQGGITTGRRMKMDLTNATQARLTCRVSTVASTGTKLAAQYSTDETSWFFLSGTASGSAPAASDYVLIDGTASTTNVTVLAWANLQSAAKADVFWRLVTVGGDGAADPVLASITFQVR